MAIWGARRRSEGLGVYAGTVVLQRYPRDAEAAAGSRDGRTDQPAATPGQAQHLPGVPEAAHGAGMPGHGVLLLLLLSLTAGSGQRTADTRRRLAGVDVVRKLVTRAGAWLVHRPLPAARGRPPQAGLVMLHCIAFPPSPTTSAFSPTPLPPSPSPTNHLTPQRWHRPLKTSAAPAAVAARALLFPVFF